MTDRLDLMRLEAAGQDWYARKGQPYEDPEACWCDSRPDPCRDCAERGNVAVVLAVCIAGALLFLLALAGGVEAVCWVNGDAGPAYCEPEAGR